MIDIDNAFKAEIADLKETIVQIPELGEEYANQAWGAFGLWLRLAGYLPQDENSYIADMREYVEELQRFGSAMQKKAGC